MQRLSNTVIADLGGTFLRIGELTSNGPENIQEIEVSQVSSFDQALRSYEACRASGSLEGCTLILSYARKQQYDEVHELPHKRHGWKWLPEKLKSDLKLSEFHVVHDAFAMGLAAFNERHEGEIFRYVRGARTRKPGKGIVILAGTGLGHSIINRADRSIHDTHGGHFPPVAVTEEQSTIASDAAAYTRDRAKKADKNTKSKTFVFEELLSGSGFYNIYLAVCRRDFADPIYSDERHALENVDDQRVRQTAKLYSEFLGLYAHIVANVSHAYESVYLCGGFLHRLVAADLLDLDAFHRNFTLNMVDSVNEDLRSAQVYRLSGQHTALYGLEEYAFRLHGTAAT